jgi:spore coat polysaccharide biosynthesis protein SpsF
MVNENTFIIVQARMNSGRLPGKVMIHINDTPMIGIMLKRLKTSGFPIILATSENPENNILSEYAQKEGVHVYRGSEENVLERYFSAAQKYGAKNIIRVTGDNPLVDGLFIQSILKDYNNLCGRTYFSSGRGLAYPAGLSFEYFSFELLEEAYRNATSKSEREHVTPYMHQNVPGDIEMKTIYCPGVKYDYRLTVDTKKDLKLLTILIERYRCHTMSHDEILECLDNHPELYKINASVEQRDWNS